MRDVETAPQEEATATKPQDPSLILGTHMVDRES